VFVNARYGYDIRCELVGETGTLKLDEQVAPDFRARFATAYRLELDAWVRAVGNGGGDGPSAWDGYAANAVADACLASLASGATAPVQLAERPALYG
jgi:myo-inositol 2-dehydrogenase / D-chiro-inositol 1-dehydrogenase